jgi:Transposase, Mutator family
VCLGKWWSYRNNVLLFAVTIDGNNKTLLLAYAVVLVENAWNWTWFLDCLSEHFHGIRIVQSDADKGIRSTDCQQVLAYNHITACRCVFHMLENCKVPKSKQTERRLVLDMAKAFTSEGYHKKKEELSQMSAGGQAIADWFDEWKHEFATYCKFDEHILCTHSSSILTN